MNKKGFTLIEVLTIVILLGILATILVSLFDDDLFFVKQYASDSQIRLIEESAEMYYLNYKNEIPSIETDNIVIIDVQALINKGFIKEKDLRINGKTTVNYYDSVIIYLIDNEVYTLFDIEQKNNPIIVLKGPLEIKIRTNGEYFEYGAIVINPAENTIIDLHETNYFGADEIDTSVPDTYNVTYTYPQADSVIRKVIVEDVSTSSDNNKPVITLIGGSTINLTVGSTYVEYNATATDIEDGNISSRITISGSVNTNIKGTYYKYYDVSDIFGNKADTVKRTIIVN